MIGTKFLPMKTIMCNLDRHAGSELAIDTGSCCSDNSQEHHESFHGKISEFHTNIIIIAFLIYVHVNFYQDGKYIRIQKTFFWVKCCKKL